MRPQKYFCVYRDGEVSEIVQGLKAVYATKRDYYTAYKGYHRREDAEVYAFWHNRLRRQTMLDDAARATEAMAQRAAARLPLAVTPRDILPTDTAATAALGLGVFRSSFARHTTI